jgi:hypothetical protein
MSILDPKQDAAALGPLVNQLEENITNVMIPALQQALTNALDGLTVTITISKKVTS